MIRRSLVVGFVGMVIGATSTARADEPIVLRAEWQGPVAFLATGAAMASDGPDADLNVDMSVMPATVEINSAEIPDDADLLAAYLYWAGSIPNTDCGGSFVDQDVGFLPPGGVLSEVQADACFCSEAGAGSYDMQLCRSEVTSLITEPTGVYLVSSFAALIDNQSTHNASFSLVLVYRQEDFDPRRIALYDGLQTMSSAINASATFNLDGLEIDDPAKGDLTWYVMEGDVGGSAGEQVTVGGLPGGGTLQLSDPLNPSENPMNHTINTTVPTQSDTIGVDIDRFDISSALSPADTAVEMHYEAGNDKYWIGYNIVGVNIFAPVFGAQSSKTWQLEFDSDEDGESSVGDHVRYTIALSNTGSATGTVTLTDTVAPEASSWQLIDAGGGTDLSTGDTLIIEDLTVAAGEEVSVVFDAVLGDVPDFTVLANTAKYEVSGEGKTGQVTAPDVVIRRDEDGDLFYDNDDNCPATPNPGQVDSDNDGVGDACESDPAGTGGTMGAGGAGGVAPGGAPGVTPEPTTASGCACTVRARGSDRGLTIWLLGLLLSVCRRVRLNGRT